MLTPELAASFGCLAANHLWQSTGFAAVAVLLALALRANHARARYWLWLAASVKFLVPFSVLAAIGASLGKWIAPSTPVSRLPFVMEQIVQPFAPVQGAAVPAAAVAPVTANLLPPLLLAFWFCGFLAVLLYGWARWRRVAAAVHSSTPLTEGRELEAWGRLAARQPAGRLSIGPRGDYQSPRSLASCPTEKGHATVRLVASAAKLEPGVFGILRAVLWLPAGIGDRLDDAELEAILAHELCHIRRRDNLLATIHMAVEAVFWFHPLVWWLGARLEEERERACDEEVVRMGGEPQIYAESILKVCEFYLASPVACAAGVTGGELKKRIEGIMTNRFTRELSFGKKILLASAAILFMAGPIVVGSLNPPQVRAQSPTAAPPKFEVASVKRTNECGGRNYIGPGSVALRGVPLKPVLMEAFSVKIDQIQGPSWLETDCFDIDAKVPVDGNMGQIPPMLQALLTERFKLAAHIEDRTRPGYALVVDKGGPKVKEDDPKANFMRSPDGRQLSAFGAFGHGGVKGVMTMAGLAANLSREGYGPVQDETGLTGKYDVDLSWARDPDLAPRDPAASVAAAPNADSAATPQIDLFAAVRTLGLRLERRNVPVQFVVIDHVDRVPTEN